MSNEMYAFMKTALTLNLQLFCLCGLHNFQVPRTLISSAEGRYTLSCVAFFMMLFVLKK